MQQMSQIQRTTLNADVSWKAKAFYDKYKIQTTIYGNSLSFRDIHLRTYPKIFLHSATDTLHTHNATYVMYIYTWITCTIYRAANKTLASVFSPYRYITDICNVIK